MRKEQCFGRIQSLCLGPEQGYHRFPSKSIFPRLIDFRLDITGSGGATVEIILRFSGRHPAIEVFAFREGSRAQYSNVKTLGHKFLIDIKVSHIIGNR